MPHDPYILFNKSIEQCRHLGARGGRAHALNSRLRRLASAPAAAAPAPQIQLPVETTAQAIATLDAQFPWLRGAEKRTPSRTAVSLGA